MYKFIIYTEIRFDSPSGKLDTLLAFKAITQNSEWVQRVDKTTRCNTSYKWFFLSIS